MTATPRGARSPSRSFGPFRPLGTTGLRNYNGTIAEEFLPQLSGTRGMAVYREMMDNDAIVGAIFTLMDSLARQTDFYFEPADDQDPYALEAAAFAESCIADLDHSWADFISEVLSCLGFGWSYFETTYKQRLGDRQEGLVPSSRENDFRIGWGSFAIRAQETLQRWEIDKQTSEILGMHQQDITTGTLAFIPIEKALHFRTRSHKNNPEGRSILRNAYRSWFFLKRMQEIEAIGVERDLAGMPVMEVPPEILHPDASAEDKAILADLQVMIGQVRRDEREGLVLPAAEVSDPASGTTIKTGYKFSLMSSGGTRQIGIGDAITRYENRIASSCLSDFILLGSDKVGSFALASSKTNMFSRAFGAILNMVCESFTKQAIAPLMRMNGYPSSVWPTLEHGDVEAPPLEEIGAYIQQMVGSGVIVPSPALEKKVLQIASLPQPGEEG
jgi:hypothetical protein